MSLYNCWLLVIATSVTIPLIDIAKPRTSKHLIYRITLDQEISTLLYLHLVPWVLIEVLIDN
jgi:hypothetical protein